MSNLSTPFTEIVGVWQQMEGRITDVDYVINGSSKSAWLIHEPTGRVFVLFRARKPLKWCIRELVNEQLVTEATFGTLSPMRECIREWMLTSERLRHAINL